MIRSRFSVVLSSDLSEIVWVQPQRDGSTEASLCLAVPLRTALTAMSELYKACRQQEPDMVF